MVCLECAVAIIAHSHLAVGDNILRMAPGTLFVLNPQIKLLHDVSDQLDFKKVFKLAVIWIIMHHVAFMKQEFLQMILDGTKTIESRWYRHKKDPYGRISMGDVVYFKGVGKPVTLKADVAKVMFFEGLDAPTINDILMEYGERIGVDESFIDAVGESNYCILVFLTNIARIIPFEINKKGYGNQAAWIVVEDIEKIKK